jgi:hypothetical protein
MPNPTQWLQLPSGFGLPPVINDRDTELLFGPEERIRVTPLTGKKKGAKAAQIVLVHVIAVRVFSFDGPESRRCCKQDSHIMLGDQPPESAWVGSADRFVSKNVVCWG